jgi:hypothetical protein
MKESLLKKEFKTKDVQRLRNIITKNNNDKTVTQVGYSRKQEEHKEGDVWEENGKTWTIKNGIKMTNTKLDLVKRLLQTPLICPECKKAMKLGKLDKQMYDIHHKCSECVIKYETELKRTGQFEEYQKNIIKSGVEYHIKEMENIILELSMGFSNESYVTEDGDIETWKNNKEIQETMLQDMKEYVNKLKDSIS